jgi:60 kDa SS-A/Ro ribonucleoprotein
MNTRVTPQSKKVLGKKQVMNNAGGAVFSLNKWDYLMRFLILGSEGGTYYVGENKLTRDNAKNVESCIMEDAKRVVDMCVMVSDAGRAPKNDPAIFVLAMVAGIANEIGRKYALDNLHRVCRIGTHLFHFAEYVNQFRGWGHGLRRAVGRWYLERPTNKLAMQLVKYQSRDGWSHRDLLRLAHPHTRDLEKNFALRWAVKGVDDETVASVVNRRVPVEPNDPLATIWAFEQVKKETDEQTIIRLVREYSLPLETIPTEKQTKNVLAAALENLGITAIIRNLGRYSKEGILTPMSAETNYVVEKLLDAETLKKGRVHPIAVLTALMTYKSGKGMRGSSTWDVVSKIVDALDEAFYLSFGTVEPTGKRILLALDVSGSMTSSFIGNLNMTAREASAAMAMVTARTEDNYEIVGFTSGGYNASTSQWSLSHGLNTALRPLDITPRRRLDDIIRYTNGLPFGGTDCALPMIYAKDQKKKFDAFIIYTDNETWAGNIHPFQALKQYRDASGIDARLIVVGMTATKFTIADPSDKGMLDVVGFDTATPNVISSFIRGDM